MTDVTWNLVYKMAKWCYWGFVRYLKIDIMEPAFYLRAWMRIFYQLLHFSSDFVEFCVGNVKIIYWPNASLVKIGSVKALIYFRAQNFPHILSTFFVIFGWYLNITLMNISGFRKTWLWEGLFLPLAINATISSRVHWIPSEFWTLKNAVGKPASYVRQ